MKKTVLFILCIFSACISAQPYSSQNINLLSLIDPHPGTGVGPDGRKYAGCWGWKQPVTNKEYAIVGSSIGTYFIDVTTPSTPSVCAFVPGKQGCTWREIKTYQNYCYVVSDDGSPNTFQIIDMAALPATVTVVHDDKTYFERGHTIWIDNDKMYIGSTTYSVGNTPAYSSMNLYSLATPSAPVLLRSLNTDFPSITTVHDMFVRNDTIYASCGNQGLYILKYIVSVGNFIQLGSYTGYAFSGYNHSSYITANGKNLVFCDEVPAALPIKIVDVQNPANVQPASTFIPHIKTTPHNPYVLGNNLVVVACYQDGLNIYNISNPNNVYNVGFFDTYPQGGFNTGDYQNADYRGNWGAYPYLPSGIIIATDMQNGVFLLDAGAAAVSTGIKTNTISQTNMLFYPNPANDRISLNYSTNNISVVQIKNAMGQLFFEKRFAGSIHDYINVTDLASGTYLISIVENDNVTTKKLIVNH